MAKIFKSNEKLGIHTPVLLQEVMSGLKIQEGNRYLDATAGQGGHLKAMLERRAWVLAIDRDPTQIENLIRQMADKYFDKVKIVGGNFSEIEKIAKKNNFYPVDGVLFDLGLSMAQIRTPGRGLSYEGGDEQLDMRLDTGLTTKAKDIINTFSEKDLYEILAKFSEDVNSRSISQALIRARSLKNIETVGELKRVIDQTLGYISRRTYARIFQALRIVVNDELTHLQKGLLGAVAILKSTGRIGVITYHSLEDRLIKKFIRENNFRIIGKKIIKGDKDQVFSRSAKLRIFAKT